MVGLKKTNSEASSSRGYFRNQFRQNSTTNNKPSSPSDIAINEEIFNTIWAVLSLSETSSNQETVDHEEEEQSENEEEFQEPQQLNGHFWDSLVKDSESRNPPSGQHAYNTRSIIKFYSK